jgi:inner membrane protein
LAYASHTLLDWLGTDTSAPIGIMALWPFSRAYYESSLHVFMAVSRRFRQPELFWMQNLAALARELLILVPIAIGVAIGRRRR